MALRETENRCLCFSYMVIEAVRRGQCRTPYNAEKQYPLSHLAQGVFSSGSNASTSVRPQFRSLHNASMVLVDTLWPAFSRRVVEELICP
jgi:hypothetical protein